MIRDINLLKFSFRFLQELELAGLTKSERIEKEIDEAIQVYSPSQCNIKLSSL